MKRIIYIIVVFAMLGNLATAEEAVERLIDASGIDAFEEFARDFSVDRVLEFVADGENLPIADAWNYLKNHLHAPVSAVLRIIKSMILPILLLGLFGASMSQNGGGARLVCRLALYGGCADLMLLVQDSAKDCLALTIRFSDVAAPVLSAVLTAGGMGTTSALISPAAALAGNLVARLFQKYGLPLCAFACCTAIAGNLGSEPSLGRLTKMIKKILSWGSGLAVSLFTALIFLKGNAAGLADNLALRTAKYAVDSATPIIGNGVSDAWETYLSGLMIAKNAVGVTGAAALLSVCIRPMFQMAAAMFALGILSVILDMCGEKPAAGAMEQLSGVCQMALSLCGGAMVIWIILMGSVMALGRI